MGPQYTNSPVNNWRQFRKMTAGKCNLLKELDKFSDSVLVTGCQRSGTTMLARIITQSEGMVNYWFGHDDELDAALILSGSVDHVPQGRYCFQTTYLDGCYHEYCEHAGEFKMVWMLRNPYSTIYSLLNNWHPRSLKGTFDSFVASSFSGIDKWAYRFFGARQFSRLKQACMIYNKKISQFFELHSKLGTEKILLVDYDELVLNKETLLPGIYQFIDLNYTPSYAAKIHSKSLKKSSGFSKNEVEAIKALCEPLYLRAKDRRLRLEDLKLETEER